MLKLSFEITRINFIIYHDIFQSIQYNYDIDMNNTLKKSQKYCQEHSQGMSVPTN